MLVSKKDLVAFIELFAPEGSRVDVRPGSVFCDFEHPLDSRLHPPLLVQPVLQHLAEKCI